MDRMSAFRVVSVGVVLPLLFAAPPAAASSISLDDPAILGTPIVLQTLIGQGSVQVGDKLFDQFFYSSTGDMPDASGVNVIPIVDAYGNYGLRFQGGFVDLYGDGPSDALISYRVTVTEPGFLISDVHLSGNPSVFGKKCHSSRYGCQASGVLGVTETFLLDDPFTELVIYDIDPGPSQLVDWALLTTPLQTLHVQKNILAFADKKKTVATLSFIDQTFSQVTAIPEPSTISLLIVGLAAAWQMRRISRIRRP